MFKARFLRASEVVVISSGALNIKNCSTIDICYEMGSRMEEPLPLKILVEKTLHQPIDPSLIAYCPSMDLVALGGADQQVLVYRLNGQRVYGASQKSGGVKVQKICWKPSGIYQSV